MSAESPIWKVHTNPVWPGPRGSAFGGRPDVCYKVREARAVIARRQWRGLPRNWI